MTTLEIYTDILIVMALFIFIVNQLGVFYDRVHIDFVTRKTRKMLASQQRNQKLNVPNDVKIREPREVREWHMPRLNWGIIGAAFGVFILILLLFILGYILLMYQP